MSHPHLVVSISGHGFGHVAQTAPILNALHGLMPQLSLTLRSAVPIAHLRSRIHAPFAHLQSVGDIGMVMSSALDVLATDSRVVYQNFHANWDERVSSEADLLRELQADFVFSNVGYLPLAGAQQAGIANAALCSLNWFDIYSYYCGASQAAMNGANPTLDEKIAAQIHTSYASAEAFLRATPGMMMESLPNVVPVAPIAEPGIDRREELNSQLHLSHDEKLVLVSMGGIAMRLPMESWPRIDGVRFLVQKDWRIEHPDAIVLETLGMSFCDLLASCDVLLCKPGYGSFVEAACSGTSVLYVSRAEWPESPALIEWLERHGTCREVTRQQLELGDIAEPLASLFQQPGTEILIPAGAAQVADWLARRLVA